MKIMITGAAGWLGRYVTDLLSPQHELVLLDQARADEATIFDPASPGGRRVEPLTTDWPYHQVDLGDREGLAAAMSDAEVVIHLAAKPTGDWEGAEVTMQTNVIGTFNLLRAAVAQGTRRVVSASSINAYGTFFWRVSGLPPVRSRLPLIETDPPVPEDPYSLSKLTGELMTATFTRAFGLETVNLRFAGVFPEQRYDQMMTDGLPPTTEWGRRPVPVGARPRRHRRDRAGRSGRHRHPRPDRARRRRHPGPRGHPGPDPSLPSRPAAAGPRTPAGPRPAALDRARQVPPRLRPAVQPGRRPAVHPPG